MEGVHPGDFPHLRDQEAPQAAHDWWQAVGNVSFFYLSFDLIWWYTWPLGFIRLYVGHIHSGKEETNSLNCNYVLATFRSMRFKKK